MVSKQIIFDALLDHLGQAAKRDLLQLVGPADLNELSAAISSARNGVLRLVQEAVRFVDNHNLALA